jgi:hypothetical protein
MKNKWLLVLALAGVAAPAAAQPQEQIRVRQEAIDKQVAEDGATIRQLRIIGNPRERVAVEARTTTGAPYSAEAVTESTQTLADGNRINRKTTTRVYRDNEGRTRREQLNNGGAVESVSIVDPVRDTTYVVESDAAAERPSAREAGGAAAPGTNVMYKRNVIKVAGPADAAKMKAELGALEHPRVEGSPEERPVREDLGTSTIEGLRATGTRTTTTIPAGAIGNLQPIKVVSEEWFSPDLQVMLLTRHSDPRSGETVYRLVNVVRAEPDASLFTVPSDSRMRESGIRLPEESAK